MTKAYREEGETKIITVRISDLFRAGSPMSGGTRGRNLMFEGEQVFMALLMLPSQIPSRGAVMTRGTIGYIPSYTGGAETLVELHRDDWVKWGSAIYGVRTAKGVRERFQGVVENWKGRIRSEVAEGMSDHDVDALISNLAFEFSQLIDSCRDTPEDMYKELERHENL